jgi:hypothetical protein
MPKPKIRKPKPRNPFVVDMATNYKSGPFKDKRKKRAKNKLDKDLEES